MKIKLLVHACAKGSLLPVLPEEWKECMIAHIVEKGSPILSEDVSAGSVLAESPGGRPLFRILGRTWIPYPDMEKQRGGAHAPLLYVNEEFSENILLELEIIKNFRTCSIITLSDKGAEGLRQDRAGPAIADMLAKKFPSMRISRYMIRDDANTLKALLTHLALELKINLVVTNGGTGLSPRDVTPQATSAVLDYALPGFSVAMLQASLAKTPNAAISRAVCGVLGNCLIINVPGSLKGATENFEAIMPALSHALDKINGDKSDCGG